MDLPIVTMDRAAAREAFLAYRAQVRARHEGERSLLEERLAQQDREMRARVAAEDEALLRGYRALSQGKQVISLSQTVVAGGLDTAGLPRIAVGRADQTEIRVHFDVRAVVWFGPPQANGTTSSSKQFRVRGLPSFTGKRPWMAWHEVPRVPAALRPAADLSNYAVLFEAVSWRTAETSPRRGGDPALLAPLGGDLYAVLAVWDLSPLEKAVLGLEP